jgi:hypothetical protein
MNILCVQLCALISCPYFEVSCQVSKNANKVFEFNTASVADKLWISYQILHEKSKPNYLTLAKFSLAFGLVQEAIFRGKKDSFPKVLGFLHVLEMTSTRVISRPTQYILLHLTQACSKVDLNM